MTDASTTPVPHRHRHRHRRVNPLGGTQDRAYCRLGALQVYVHGSGIDVGTSCDGPHRVYVPTLLSMLVIDRAIDVVAGDAPELVDSNEPLLIEARIQQRALYLIGRPSGGDDVVDIAAVAACEGRAESVAGLYDIAKPRCHRQLLRVGDVEQLLRVDQRHCMPVSHPPGVMGIQESSLFALAHLVPSVAHDVGNSGQVGIDVRLSTFRLFDVALEIGQPVGTNVITGQIDRYAGEIQQRVLDSPDVVIRPYVLAGLDIG